ncbi:MAG: hypothetical protein R2816_01900 [Flavobacteriaceae bacterium]|nr:hypothetical protein [Flavobacteriaceae bacterium]
MKINLYIISIVFFMVSSINSQEKLPPPPCYANYNTGASGVIGNGHFLKTYSGDDITMHFSNGYEVEFNDVLVFYIATSAPGRNTIDQTVDDSYDPYRIAITNSNAYGYGSTITFPEGFEASYAIAIDTNSGGLYSIPNSGNVGNGGLNYITSVNSTLSTNTQRNFVINFTPSDIGIANEEEFYFVGLYVSHNGYTYDEGYGDGILPGTIASDDITFTGYRSYGAIQAGCTTITMDDKESNYNSIDAKYVNNKLQINGLYEEVTIAHYDLMGRVAFKSKQQINGETEIPINVLKNQIQFILIESSNKRKVLKVLSTSH